MFNQEQQLVAGQVLQDLQDFQAAEVVYFQGAEVLRTPGVEVVDFRVAEVVVSLGAEVVDFQAVEVAVFLEAVVTQVVTQVLEVEAAVQLLTSCLVSHLAWFTKTDVSYAHAQVSILHPLIMTWRYM